MSKGNLILQDNEMLPTYNVKYELRILALNSFVCSRAAWVRIQGLPSPNE